MPDGHRDAHGDRGYDAVRADFVRTAPWVGAFGVLAFHDFGSVHFPGVSRVVGEALATGDWIMVAVVERLAVLRRAHWIAPDWL